MSTQDTKDTHIGTRIDADLKQEIVARTSNVDGWTFAWVLRKVIELGWPEFCKKYNAVLRVSKPKSSKAA